MSFAARLGDSCAHGGVIVVGCPTVLIGNMPAARVGDNHVCPMATPGTPPIPHVGGPILPPGSPTVFIGGMPAARVGDMATCVGPPDSIIVGCPTVMIGTAGSGSGSGGGAGSSGAASANASAKNALSDNVESTTREEHWIEFDFEDKAGNPVSGVYYKFTDPDGNETQNYLKPDGRVSRDAMSEGEGKVELISLYNANWSKEKTKPGDTVKLSIEAEGIKDDEEVTFNIYRRDISGADTFVKKLEEKITGNKSEAEWTVGASDDDETNSEKSAKGYSSPEYYFIVHYGPTLKTRSGFLYIEDFIEIELKDEENNPIADEEYVIFAPNGEVRNGKLNISGYAKEEKLPGGICSIKFPNLPKFQE
ncbi:MAG: PAAR domain-containing protein [Ignavibacteriaceae bacterium]